MAEHMKEWRAENPGRPVKDAMSAVSHILLHSLIMSMLLTSLTGVQVAALWRDSPENPKRGQEPKKKAAKKAPAEKPTSRATKKKLASSSDTEAAE